MRLLNLKHTNYNLKKEIINVYNKLFKFNIIILVLIAFIIFLFPIKINASTKKEGIENFPESYKPYLTILKQKYPNWNFVALYTGLDWKYVIDNENIFGKNLVPKSYSDNWKNTKEGEYNIEVDSGWVDSSRKAVEYTMDPRNFLNEVRMFQFETLAYDEKTNVSEGIEKILYGTEFYNKIVEYKDSTGNNIVTNKKYSDLILNAGITSKVSTYHLASRIKQEVGPFLSHHSISGIVPGYEGLYNFYNIGATSSSEPMGAIKNGLRYAKDGKGASQEIRNKYIIPWNTKEKAITGGGIFIGSSYINIGQYTIYLQKFDVNDEKPGELFWHQYMTNVLAPYSESKLVYNGYKNNGVLNSKLTFIIPVYENMPELPTETPNILSTDFISDNKKMYANVTTSLNVRTGPGSNYEIITTIGPKEEVTRIAKGKQSGELWDRVILKNGAVGYVFQSYLLEVEDKPEEPNEPEVPQEPEQGNELVINGNEITGLDYKNNTVKAVKEQIETEHEIKILDQNGNELSEDKLVGTGCKIQLIQNNNVVQEYYFILYGDVNGDGKINSVDLLVLQRHILEIKTFDGLYSKAANINKDGKKPSSVDLLLIQRHILGLKIIEQRSIS